MGHARGGWIGVMAGLLLAATAGASPHVTPGRDWGADCAACHVPGRTPDLLGDQIAMCVRCHEAAAVKHMVGMRPDFVVPSRLPLDAHGRITCLTCHHAHGELRGDGPWASVSLLERLTGSERLRKTYLLREKNTDGELCRACHGF